MLGLSLLVLAPWLLMGFAVAGQPGGYSGYWRFEQFFVPFGAVPLFAIVTCAMGVSALACEPSWPNWRGSIFRAACVGVVVAGVVTWNLLPPRHREIGRWCLVSVGPCLGLALAGAMSMVLLAFLFDTA